MFHAQIAASPEASYVSIEEVPKEFVDSETAIEMGKEDILAKPENIRCGYDACDHPTNISCATADHGCTWPVHCHSAWGPSIRLCP